MKNTRTLKELKNKMWFRAVAVAYTALYGIALFLIFSSCYGESADILTLREIVPHAKTCVFADYSVPIGIVLTILSFEIAKRWFYLAYFRTPWPMVEKPQGQTWYRVLRILYFIALALVLLYTAIICTVSAQAISIVPRKDIIGRVKFTGEICTFGDGALWVNIFVVVATFEVFRRMFYLIYFGRITASPTRLGKTAQIVLTCLIVVAFAVTVWAMTT